MNVQVDDSQGACKSAVSFSEKEDAAPGKYFWMHPGSRRRRGAARSALRYRLPRSQLGILPAQVGKYRSSGYLQRQSRHNLRRVRCARLSETNGTFRLLVSFLIAGDHYCGPSSLRCWLRRIAEDGQ